MYQTQAFRLARRHSKYEDISNAIFKRQRLRFSNDDHFN